MEPMPRGRIALIAAALVLAAATGFGQTSKGRGTGKAVVPKTPPAAAAKDGGGPRLEPETASSAAAPPMTGRAETKTQGAKAVPGDAGVTVTERDGGAKQFRFTETDIEGRLKAPQLVYFLRRVRAEFAAGDLGHRSFMRELSETRRDPNF
jgi:hypothetical protein